MRYSSGLLLTSAMVLLNSAHAAGNDRWSIQVGIAKTHSDTAYGCNSTAVDCDIED